MAISTGRTPGKNGTPLIDVLLVLLIIFMVVAPARPSQFDTKVPSRPDSDRPHPPVTDVLVVTLTTNQGLLLNGAMMTRNELGSELASTLADRVDRTVIVRAPKSVSYRDVVQLIDDIKGAGAGPIGLQVDYLES